MLHFAVYVRDTKKIQASMQRSAGSQTTASRSREDFPETVFEFRRIMEAVVSSGAIHPRFTPSSQQPQRERQSQSKQRHLPNGGISGKAEVRRCFFLLFQEIRSRKIAIST